LASIEVEVFFTSAWIFDLWKILAAIEKFFFGATIRHFKQKKSKGREFSNLTGYNRQNKNETSKELTESASEFNFPFFILNHISFCN